MKTIQKIAKTIQTIKYLEQKGSSALQNRERIRNIEKELLPSGSGIDSGTRIDVESSRTDRIVLTFGFHHMDQNGYYCGWTDYQAIVKPTFDGFDVEIKGRNINMIKDYLYDTFYWSLDSEIPSGFGDKVTLTLKN